VELVVDHIQKEAAGYSLVSLVDFLDSAWFVNGIHLHTIVRFKRGWHDFEMAIFCCSIFIDFNLHFILILGHCDFLRHCLLLNLRIRARVRTRRDLLVIDFMARTLPQPLQVGLALVCTVQLKWPLWRRAQRGKGYISI
jgi:hypothetical protein